MFERRRHEFSLTRFHRPEFGQANGGGVTNLETRSNGLPADPAFVSKRDLAREFFIFLASSSGCDKSPARARSGRGETASPASARAGSTRRLPRPRVRDVNQQSGLNSPFAKSHSWNRRHAIFPFKSRAFCSLVNLQQQQLRNNQMKTIAPLAFFIVLCLTTDLLAAPPRRFVLEKTVFLGADTVVVSGHGENLVRGQYEYDRLPYGCIAITFAPTETLVRLGCQIDQDSGPTPAVYDLPGTKLAFSINDKENIGAALAALKKCDEWGKIAATNKVDEFEKRAGDFVYRNTHIAITFRAVDRGAYWLALLSDDTHHIDLKPIFSNEVPNLFYLFENIDKLAATMKAQLQEHNQAVTTKKKQTEELFK
jgi:hypothetical protein